MRPIVIAIASGKGGTGKSLLTVSLAVKAASEGYHVAMVDLEPQSSVHLWWKLRGRPKNPSAVDASDRIPSDVVAGLRGEFDCILVDTSPLGMDRIEEAISAADGVLIPVRASVFDADAVRAVTDICKDMRKPFAFVAMDYDAAWRGLNSSMASLLAKMGKVMDARTSHRSAYPSSLNLGKSAAEHPDSRQRKEAAAEIDDIWKATKALVGAHGKR